VRARDDDGEPLEHRTARVLGDLETWSVPWTPQEDEAFNDFPRASLLAPVPPLQASGPPSSPHGPDADGHDLKEAA
jgi:hypothetical protein